MSPIVSEQYQFVIGVDTHASTHTLAVLVAATGTVLHKETFPTSSPGLGRALGWIARRIGEASVMVVVEGTGSYGAILTERLELAGHRVAEAASMPAGDRRGIGKSDALDAARIARAVLGLHDGELRTPERYPLETTPPAAPGSHSGCSSWPATKRPKNAPAPSTS